MISYRYKDFKKIRHFVKKTNKKDGKPYFFFSRSSAIGPHLTNKVVFVFNGKKWKRIVISRFMVGKKLGEFFWTRSFNKKKPKKKKKK